MSALIDDPHPATSQVNKNLREEAGVGYHHEFVDQIRPEEMCSICMLVLKAPMQIKECGHDFCKSCLDVWFKSCNGKAVPTCPIDNIAINRKLVFMDMRQERAILNLRVYCENKVKGCKATPDLRDYQKHHITRSHDFPPKTNEAVLVVSDDCQLVGQRREYHVETSLKKHFSECDFEKTDCPLKCGKRYKEHELKLHQQNDCPCRKVTCECHAEMLYHEMQAHNDTCDQKIVNCPYCKSCKKILRKDLYNHWEVCRTYPIPCEFAKFGCPTKHVERNRVHIHDKQETQCHLKTMSASITSLYDAVGVELKPMIDLNNNNNKKTTGQNGGGYNLNNNNNTTGNNNNNAGENSNNNNNNNVAKRKSVVDRLDELETLYKKQCVDMASLVETNHKLIESIKNPPSGKGITLQVAPNFTLDVCPIQWKVRLVSALKVGHVMYGPRFYTKRGGYKFGLNVMKRYSTSEKLQSVWGVRCVILQGDYDDVLQWPGKGNEKMVIKRDPNEVTVLEVSPVDGWKTFNQVLGLGSQSTEIEVTITASE